MAVANVVRTLCNARLAGTSTLKKLTLINVKSAETLDIVSLSLLFWWKKDLPPCKPSKVRTNVRMQKSKLRTICKKHSNAIQAWCLSVKASNLKSTFSTKAVLMPQPLLLLEVFRLKLLSFTTIWWKLWVRLSSWRLRSTHFRKFLGVVRRGWSKLGRWFSLRMMKKRLSLEVNPKHVLAAPKSTCNHCLTSSKWLHQTQH